MNLRSEIAIPTCKTPGCDRAPKDAAMCRRCRIREVHGGDVVMTHTVGEVQHLMRQILDHYPTVREAIASTGISIETFYRIMKRDARASLKTTVYQKIMAAADVLNGPPIETEPGAVSWPEVAEYARTPEGLAFIAQCRRRANHRKACAA